MKKLKELLEALPSCKVSGDANLTIEKMEYDSRRVGSGDLFVALEGYSDDGHRYIKSALDKGAVAVIIQKDGDYRSKAKVVVPDTREVLAILSNRFYDYPWRRLKLVGVTGTNGKTTITYLVRSILQQNDKKVGLVGTIAYWIDRQKINAPNTTPESLDLQRMLAQMTEQGIYAAVMEVSSHALVMHRVDGMEFDVAVFTNLNHEHLDFHLTMDAYREAKGRLFKKIKKVGVAVINRDDPQWKYFYDLAETNRWTYSLTDPEADFYTINYTCTPAGSSIQLATPKGEMTLHTKLIGESNVYNTVAAVAVGFALKIDPTAIKSGLEDAEVVPGRMESILAGQAFNLWIDYAHTPHAFEVLLKTARNMTRGRLFFLFGCGGDRDQGKRPLMGKVASRYADRIYLTEDNPRSEDPQEIVAQIIQGMEDKSKVEVIIDRKEGIKKALETARPGDTLILAGKGHEDYQIIGDKKLHFSDKETALELLSADSKVKGQM
ncbi:MAG: UDP-N-acetylmuramoyl-L-alanyl-D-glutamate--2,6-diaminopimelate ligase [Candidatus Zixiibacteriota bacterium]